MVAVLDSSMNVSRLSRTLLEMSGLLFDLGMLAGGNDDPLLYLDASLQGLPGWGRAAIISSW